MRIIRSGELSPDEEGLCLDSANSLLLELEQDEIDDLAFIVGSIAGPSTGGARETGTKLWDLLQDRTTINWRVNNVWEAAKEDRLKNLHMTNRPTSD